MMRARVAVGDDQKGFELRASVSIAVLVGVLLVAGCGGDSASTTTSDAAPVAASLPVPSGSKYTDPETTYTMIINPAWVERAGLTAEGVETWEVEGAKDGFAPNVNVLTEDAPGMDLAKFMSQSDDLSGMHVIQKATIKGANGNELGLVEYTGTVANGSASRPLHFLGVVDVHDGKAIVATLTVDESSFAAERAKVEPYMRTLQAA
jgi:hypothetical protein